MQKIKSIIKLYSCIIIPTVIFAVLLILDQKFSIIRSVNGNKIESLININVSLIGVLLTVLTIYVSFPKSEKLKEKLKKSGHERILLSNIFTGFIIYVISVLCWIFNNCDNFIAYFFCCGMGNVIITGYYIYRLSKVF